MLRVGLAIAAAVAVIDQLVKWWIIDWLAEPPGFVEVTDERTILIPERPGNRLAFGFRNILETGRVGVIFLVPGQRETLRINGRASLTRDPGVLERLAAKGKPALLATRIDVDECFFHCGKALIRSGAWDQAAHRDDLGSKMAENTARQLGAEADAEVTDVISNEIEKNYVEELY